MLPQRFPTANMTAKFDYAAAEVSDSQYVYRVEYNPYAENFFIVYDEGGAVLESYLRLEDCVYSRFSGIFLALQKAMNACNLVYGTNILSEITSSKEISAEGGRITASNRFTYRGKQSRRAGFLSGNPRFSLHRFRQHSAAQRNLSGALSGG